MCLVSVSMVGMGCCMLIHVTILVDEDCEPSPNGISSTPKKCVSETVDVCRITFTVEPVQNLYHQTISPDGQQEEQQADQQADQQHEQQEEEE